MSKFLVAAVSFAAGICVTLLFSGQDRKVEAASQYQVLKINGTEKSIPTFEPLNMGFVLSGMSIGSGPEVLDGLNCLGCTFDNADLIYNGGPFNLAGLKVSGTTHISLRGAAANTVAFLTFMEKTVGLGVDDAPPPPQKPIVKEFPTEKLKPKQTPHTYKTTSPYTSIGGGQ